MGFANPDSNAVFKDLAYLKLGTFLISKPACEIIYIYRKLTKNPHKLPLLPEFSQS